MLKLIINRVKLLFVVLIFFKDSVSLNGKYVVLFIFVGLHNIIKMIKWINHCRNLMPISEPI